VRSRASGPPGDSEGEPEPPIGRPAHLTFALLDAEMRGAEIEATP
jgi:hypothetical protein